MIQRGSKARSTCGGRSGIRAPGACRAGSALRYELALARGAMPLLSAVCDSCGAVFQPRAINVENSANVLLSNVRVGPCPRCGGMGWLA